jgi:hypothetical protein
MTQPLPDHSTTQPISTVTKHIKIYSDNPIHDCIDRIIDAVAVIDEGSDRDVIATAKLFEAADELLELAIELSGKNSDELNRITNERLRNK